MTREFMLMRRIGGSDANAYETDQVRQAYRDLKPGESVEVAYLRGTTKRDVLERQAEARGWKVMTKRRDGSVMFARTNPVSAEPLDRLFGYRISHEEKASLLEHLSEIEGRSDTPRRRTSIIHVLAMVNNDLDGAGVEFIQASGQPPSLIYVDRNSADKLTLMFLCKEGRFVVGSLREGINATLEEE